MFSEVEVDALVGTLINSRRTPTLVTYREHVQNFKRRSDPAADRKCPKCGSPQVIRSVKSGPRAGQQLWGYSTFPKYRIMQGL